LHARVGSLIFCNRTFTDGSFPFWVGRLPSIYFIPCFVLIFRSSTPVSRKSSTTRSQAVAGSIVWCGGLALPFSRTRRWVAVSEPSSAARGPPCNPGFRPQIVPSASFQLLSLPLALPGLEFESDPGAQLCIACYSTSRAPDGKALQTYRNALLTPSSKPGRGLLPGHRLRERGLIANSGRSAEAVDLFIFPSS